MFCTKCGAKNPDNGNFCKNCGSLLRNPTPVKVPPASRFQGTPKPSPAAKSRDTQSVIKTAAAAPSFLLGTIFISLQMIFSFINAILIAPTLPSQIRDALAKINLSVNGYSDILKNFSSAYLFFIFLSLIPAALIIIGLWYTYIAGRRNDGSRFTTFGFTMIKVVNIVLTVMMAISAFLSIVLLIVSAALSSSYYNPEAAAISTFIFSVVGISVLLVAAFYIVYEVFVIKSLGTVIRSANTDTPSDKVSVFVAVICFIGAAFEFFNVFINIMYPVGMISSAVGMGANICFGIVILNYRTKMRELIETGANSAAYTQYSPANPQNIQDQAYQAPATEEAPSESESPVEEKPQKTPAAEVPDMTVKEGEQGPVQDENSDSE